MATYKSIKYIIPAEVVEHTDSINALADVNTSTTAPTEGQTLKWSAANSRWQPADIEEASTNISTTLGIIAGGYDSSSGELASHVYITNVGAVGSDITNANSETQDGAAITYGGDKGFFISDTSYSLMTNVGVIGSSTSCSGFDIFGQANTLTGCTYGLDKGIVGWGYSGDTGPSTFKLSKSYLITNTGVIGNETAIPGATSTTLREQCAGSSYGGDKGIVVYGEGHSSDGGYSDTTGRASLVSNVGVVASESSIAGNKRVYACGGEYGGDKAIIYSGGQNDGDVSGSNTINLISNTGVVASTSTGAGTARANAAYTRYGSDKAIIYHGENSSSNLTVTNLVSNVGVVANDTSTSNTGRTDGMGCGYGS